MENFQHGPCLDKKCSHCCDPVKIETRRIINGFKVPDIWKERDYLLTPETSPETTRIKVFDCDNLDKESGQCSDYENRPDICKNSSCISAGSTNVDQEHSNVVGQKFIKIKKL